jgi:hypothetical protein
MSRARCSCRRLALGNKAPTTLLVAVTTSGNRFRQLASPLRAGPGGVVSDHSDDQRLRVAIEHAMSDAATLATEIRGISHRVSVPDQGHIYHLRSIADRLDKLVEVLGLELQSPADVDREGARALASWGRRLSAAALLTIALIGHGGVTRGGEVAAEYLMRTLSEMISTTDEPVSPADKLGNRLSTHRQAQRLTAQELANPPSNHLKHNHRRMDRRHPRQSLPALRNRYGLPRRKTVRQPGDAPSRGRIMGLTLLRSSERPLVEQQTFPR